VGFGKSCLPLSTAICRNPSRGVGLDVGLGMARLTERGVQTARPGRHSDGDGLHLGSGLIDQSQKATAAAIQIADK
jgi:hypothetical protein